MPESDHFNHARAMLYRGFDLAKAGQHAEAMAVFEELIHAFDMETDMKIRSLVADAKLRLGIGLGHLGRPQEEITCPRYEPRLPRSFGM